MSSDSEPLALAEVPVPVPRPGEILVRVSVCAVCHTELDEIEGRTPPSALPRILGHQVVGRVVQRGADVADADERGGAPDGARERGAAADSRVGSGFSRSGRAIGDRVGVAWIYSACGQCTHCLGGDENLCPDFRATGRDADGGYAEYMTVPVAFSYPIPARFSDVQAAPLLCAGAIGYRSLRLANLEDGQSLGLTGFGASAHLVLMMVGRRYPRSRTFVFTRSPEERRFALELGAAWAGDTAETAPEPLRAIIDTTPAWKPVVEAMRSLAPGGRLVINAIRKEDRDKGELVRIDYPTHLWLEKEIKSVANVTRRDVGEFLDLAAEIPIVPEVETYPLEAANRALVDIKQGRIRGAKVLVV